MTNSLIDRFERMVVTVTSPDGQILATYNNRRRLRLRFADEDYFYEYDTETLTRQINTVLRALENGRQVGADELLKRAGFTESGSNESHWNANNRRYRQALQEMLCFGQSSDGSIHFDADGTLTDIDVEIDDDALNRLEPSTFLSELHGAFGDLLRDHADKRYLLKQQHNLVLAKIATSGR